MTERDEKSGGVGCFILGVIGAMLPPLYVFSLGPAVWIDSRFPACSPAIGFIYYPLQFASNNFEPARVFLRWYVSLWA